MPGLREIIDGSWNRERFLQWLDGFDAPESEGTPIGRRIKGPLPDGLDRRVQKLVGALKPLAERYPLPHYRRAA